MRDGESGERRRSLSLRADTGGCGQGRPFVAAWAVEPVSSRLRSGARPGGDRGTPCGERGGAASFSDSGRGAWSGRREIPVRNLGPEVLVSRSHL